MDKISIRRQLAVGIGSGALLVAMVAGPALAAEGVMSQGVEPGVFTTSIAVVNALAPVGYDHNEQMINAGSMRLTADDSTGLNLGWNVTIMSTDFAWTENGTGAVYGTTIDAVNFSLTSAAAPEYVVGEAIDLDTDAGGPDIANGPKVVTSTGTLEAPIKILAANETFGNGNYTQLLGLNLSTPAYSTAGTYTATITVTISAGP